jgi:hypothetical protein
MFTNASSLVRPAIPLVRAIIIPYRSSIVAPHHPSGFALVRSFFS